MSRNQSFLKDITESFTNRNAAEVRQTADTALKGIMSELLRFAPDPGFDPAMILRNWRAHVDVDALESGQIEDMLVFCIARVERYEQDFSGHKDLLHAPLQGTKCDGDLLDCLYADLVDEAQDAGRIARLGSLESRGLALWELWKQTVEVGAVLDKAKNMTRINSTLRVLAHYYFLFRGVREEVGSKSSMWPVARKLEEGERILRSAAFIRMAIRLRSTTDAHLEIAASYRKLACETGNAAYLHAASGEYRELIGGLAVLMGYDSTSSTRVLEPSLATMAGRADFVTRLVNHLGRTVETMALVMQRLGADLSDPMPPDPVFDCISQFTGNRPSKHDPPGAHELWLISSRIVHLLDVVEAYDGQLPVPKSCADLALAVADCLEQAGWDDARDALCAVARGQVPDTWAAAVDGDIGKWTNPAGWQLMLMGAAAVYSVVCLDTRMGDLVEMAPDHPDRQATSPTAYIAVHNRGRILARLGENWAAHEDYRQVLDSRPEFAPAHENMALAQIQLGEYALADRHFSEARALYGQHANGRTEYLDVNLGEVVVAERARKAELQRYLTQPRSVGSVDELHILKRWNSYTPTLPGKPRSLGGGYFIILGGVGIAIDPGFDFVSNLGRAGFSMNDIDAVAVTHLHLDHIEDLENLLLLLWERQKRTGHTGRRVSLICSEELRWRIHQRLDGLIADRETWSFIDYVQPASAPTARMRCGHWAWDMNPKDRLAAHLASLSEDRKVVVWQTPTRHIKRDASSVGVEPSNGFVFRVVQGTGRRKCNYLIGFTSDTKWFLDLREAFKDCDVIVAHLGEVYDLDIDGAGYIAPPPDPESSTRNHLGLSGVYHLIAPVDGVMQPLVAPSKGKLLLVGEFGEEVGVHRVRVSGKLRRAFHRRGMNVHCLAADVGLKVRIGWTQSEEFLSTSSVRVFCPYCGSAPWRPYHEISEVPLPPAGPSDDGIRYFCRRHYSEQVLQRES